MNEPVADLQTPLPRRRWWRHPVALAAMFLTYVGVLFYLGALLFIYLRHDAWMTPTSASIDYTRMIYPELHKSGVLDLATQPRDEQIDVVLIGGSTLEQTADELQAALMKSWGTGVRVYNLAMSAHTSRDTLLKFRKLPPSGIELIILYDGFNDIRMNCIPEKDFKLDYTHCDWYVNLEQKLNSDRVDLNTVMRHNLEAASKFIDLGQPTPEWLDEGGIVKTDEALRQNYAEILRTCRLRNVPVVLMTFAAYLPENYSEERFLKGELDYGDGSYRMTAESWGRPAHIRQTLAAQNQVIRELANDPLFAETVRFIDLELLFPADGTHFSDPCHFTSEGIKRFAGIISEGLPQPAIRGTGHTRQPRAKI